MSEQEYDKEQLRIMRNAFKAFDHDDRGFIEHSDVIQILEILGQKLDEKAVKALIKEVDKGNSSQLDFSQFCKIAARFVEVEEDGPALMGELKEAFRVYDKEGKGYLTVETLRGILQELDDKLSSQELDLIIEEIDADGSGTVDFDEFMQVMTVMRNAFKAFDKEDKGFIAHADVMEILVILGQKLDDKAVTKLIKEVDKGNSGKLNFSQFCKLASRFVEVDEDGPVLMGELKEAFRIYDKEGKGYITVQILRGILHELDDKLSNQDLDMIIEEIDSDGSGTVDFDEFVQVMTVMRNAFKAFDNDDKGFIEHTDVMKILEILGQKLDDKAVKALIKEVDKGNSGKLDFKQFCKLASRFVEVEEDGPVLMGELKEAFRIYDKEGKGYITVQILRDILHELDDKLSKQDLDMIIEEIDSDGSGTVDFDEFVQVMTG